MDDIRHAIPDKPTRFLDSVRLHIRTSGLAYRTEQTYIHWIKRFFYFNQKQHPKDLGAKEIEAFLSNLTVNRCCSIGTQKIALNALIYLYRRFFGLEIEERGGTRATFLKISLSTTQNPTKFCRTSVVEQGFSLPS